MRKKLKSLTLYSKYLDATATLLSKQNPIGLCDSQ